jgi:hypothetical protein
VSELEMPWFLEFFFLPKKYLLLDLLNIFSICAPVWGTGLKIGSGWGNEEAGGALSRKKSERLAVDALASLNEAAVVDARVLVRVGSRVVKDGKHAIHRRDPYQSSGMGRRRVREYEVGGRRIE